MTYKSKDYWGRDAWRSYSTFYESESNACFEWDTSYCVNRVDSSWVSSKVLYIYCSTCFHFEFRLQMQKKKKKKSWIAKYIIWHNWIKTGITLWFTKNTNKFSDITMQTFLWHYSSRSFLILNFRHKPINIGKRQNCLHYFVLTS